MTGKVTLIFAGFQEFPGAVGTQCKKKEIQRWKNGHPWHVYTSLKKLNEFVELTVCLKLSL